MYLKGLYNLYTINTISLEPQFGHGKYNLKKSLTRKTSRNLKKSKRIIVSLGQTDVADIVCTDLGNNSKLRHYTQKLHTTTLTNCTKMTHLLHFCLNVTPWGHHS